MPAFYKPKLSPGSASLFFITIFLTFVLLFSGLWKQNRITIDVPSYYAYLPATFIYKDIKLDFVNKNPEFFKDKIWFYKAPNGNRIIKHSMGMSVALLPFFLIGHWIAPLVSAPQDGYSLPYQNTMSIGVILYILLGLHFLRKALLKYFSEKAVALTILSLVIGTNLLWYITFEGLMNHGISFSLICISIYAFFQWLDKGSVKYLVSFSVLFGLLVLIRPLSIVLFFYFTLIGFFSKGGIKPFLIFLKPKVPHLLLAAGIFLFIFSPQLLYWKYISGHWYFDTYMDEHFYFNSPQVLPFLLGFRKGWLIYTPIMWFGIVGLIPLYQQNKALFMATLFSVSLSVYLFSSWWAWSYGYCFGLRPMIDSYSLLSFPMAASFSYILSKKRFFSFLLYVLVAMLIALNLFQTWQYKNGLIHFDYMTRKAYFKGFFQTTATAEWYDLLKPYNFHRREMGLPQIEYTKEYMAGINEKDLIYLRGYNLNFLSASNLHNAVLCNSSDVNSGAIFHFFRLGGDTIAIQSANGKFLSVKFDKRNILAADEDRIGPTEKFNLHQAEEGDNKITLQSMNGKYVSVVQKWSDVLCASGDDVSANETFRFFILDTQ